jgi:hypothetical protein
MSPFFAENSGFPATSHLPALNKKEGIAQFLGLVLGQNQIIGMRMGAIV